MRSRFPPECAPVHQYAEHRDGLWPEAVDQRKHPRRKLTREINAKIAQIQQGFGFSILPPPILGLGQGRAIRCTYRIALVWAMARCKTR